MVCNVVDSGRHSYASAVRTEASCRRCSPKQSHRGRSTPCAFDRGLASPATSVEVHPRRRWIRLRLRSRAEYPSRALECGCGHSCHAWLPRTSSRLVRRRELTTSCPLWWRSTGSRGRLVASVLGARREMIGRLVPKVGSQSRAARRHFASSLIFSSACGFSGGRTVTSVFRRAAAAPHAVLSMAHDG